MRRLVLFAICCSLCAAETHKVVAKDFYNAFHHRYAVLKRIAPGDVVITRTLDASGGDRTAVWWPTDPTRSPGRSTSKAPSRATPSPLPFARSG